MKTHILARNYRAPVPGVFDFYVDFATGELSGESARYFDRCLNVGGYDGMAHFAWQQSYPAPDPLHNPASMAMVLQSWGYGDIKGDLAKYPMPEPEELEYGAVA